MKSLDQNLLERQANEMAILNLKHKKQYKHDKYAFIAFSIIISILLAL